jgi:hypothetical protein
MERSASFAGKSTGTVRLVIRVLPGLRQGHNGNAQKCIYL